MTWAWLWLDSMGFVGELVTPIAFEAMFVGRGKEQILASMERFFYPGWTAWD